jgi:hypothetical protein
MDILCINQKDPGEIMTMTQHIPAIFRSAQKTIVVREGSGLRGCCIQAVGDVASWKRGVEWAGQLQRHHRFKHRNCQERNEGLFERLWVLQEIMLSNTIQFARCEEPPEDDSTVPCVSPSHLGHHILNHAILWAQEMNDAHLGFIHAFFNDGIVSRKVTSSTIYDLDHEFHTESHERTTHPRDYILALMPQYRWYKVPESVKKMSFGELFVDCCKQSQNSAYPLIPTITLSADKIPQPTCLGEFAKLLVATIDLK